MIELQIKSDSDADLLKTICGKEPTLYDSDADSDSDAESDADDDNEPDSGPAFTEIHYVTQDGAGAFSGESLENAWSAENFNNGFIWNDVNADDGHIGPGDVVYFYQSFETSRCDSWRQ